MPPNPAQMAAAAAAHAQAQAQARAAPAMAAEDQPAAKKQRTDGVAAAGAGGAPGTGAAAPAAAAAGAKGKLVPEAEFRASHPASVSLRVVLPSDPSVAFNFNGQTLDVTMQLTDSVQTLKERLSSQLNNMPPNKMKLQFAAGTGSGVTAGGTHLNKDDATLAFYNVPNGATLSVGVKERGGKKK